MFYRHKQGFTLIEVLVVLVLLSGIIAMAGGLAVVTNQSTLGVARSNLMSLLATARSDALYGRDARLIGVRVQHNDIELVSALPQATSTSLRVLETIVGGMKHVVIDSATTEFWFYPYSGRSNAPGYLVLRDQQTNATTSITITYEGIIE
jgi:prepilin-type N-terminal cleavage/methylation domain-containing protein